MDQYHALFCCWDAAFFIKRVGGIDDRDTLEVYMGMVKLRHDVVHVVVHSPVNCVDDIFWLITTLTSIAVYFLNPLQVDGGGNTYEQVDVFGNVDLITYQAAMQALIEQQV